MQLSQPLTIIQMLISIPLPPEIPVHILLTQIFASLTSLGCIHLVFKGINLGV